ncbi:nucleoside hydrolase [Kineosporia succinea]|uniref:Purine nucleosidase n=1 Tax=Kineosporia succinea TaxID=84632 RepID=A0ABT9P7X5_9ACTN|nr:nucleoside hydrolase [Kineosporia succinea]MDP9828804.1 purine nucleosidase [Kineosporia succinea]
MLDDTTGDIAGSPTASRARTVLIDCDPGHDDAIALLLAHGSPAIDLVGVSTVAGNQTLAKITRNAQSIAAAGGFSHVPIAAGATRGLVTAPFVAADIHGESGLDGPHLPEPVAPLDPRHGVQLIIDTVMTRPAGTVTIIATGPLTNLALAARLEPRIVERVREVVFMGGAIQGGNLTPTAEFNIAVDPEAAHVVVHENWEVTMIGLDVTHLALATTQVRGHLDAVGTTPARIVGEMLDFYGAAYVTSQGFACPPVHDPVAVAAIIDASVLEFRRAPIDVSLAEGPTRGMTVVDLRKPAPESCRTRVAVGLDTHRFWALVVDALTRIGEPLAVG